MAIAGGLKNVVYEGILRLFAVSKTQLLIWALGTSHFPLSLYASVLIKSLLLTTIRRSVFPRQ